MAINKVENIKDKKKSTSVKQNSVIKFFKDIKSECTRITWASKEDTKKSIMIVAAFCGMYMIYIALMDYGFGNLFKLIFK